MLCGLLKLDPDFFFLFKSVLQMTRSIHDKNFQFFYGVVNGFLWLLDLGLHGLVKFLK